MQITKDSFWGPLGSSQPETAQALKTLMFSRSESPQKITNLTFALRTLARLTGTATGGPRTPIRK